MTLYDVHYMAYQNLAHSDQKPAEVNGAVVLEKVVVVIVKVA